MLCPDPEKWSFPNPQSAYAWLETFDNRDVKPMEAYRCNCGGIHTRKVTSTRRTSRKIERPLDTPSLKV